MEKGIADYWNTVAEMVSGCIGQGRFDMANGCGKVAILLNEVPYGVALHRPDTGQPLWYNRMVSERIGVEYDRFGPVTLGRILTKAPPRSMAAFQAFLLWQASGGTDLFRFQFALNDVSGAERYWFVCCGRLPLDLTEHVPVLSLCMDVELVIGQWERQETPTAGLSPTAQQAFISLTHRERQIAALLAHGRKNNAIAQSLHISEQTVQTHRRNILQKLGVSSPMGLAQFLPLLKKESDR